MRTRPLSAPDGADGGDRRTYRGRADRCRVSAGGAADISLRLVRRLRVHCDPADDLLDRVSQTRLRSGELTALADTRLAMGFGLRRDMGTGLAVPVPRRRDHLPVHV